MSARTMGDDDDDELELFKEMLGSRFFSDVNRFITDSLQDMHPTMMREHDVYKLTLHINNLDISHCKTHPKSCNYFKTKYNQVHGIPNELLKRCISLPPPLELLRIDIDGAYELLYTSSSDVCCPFSRCFACMWNCCVPFFRFCSSRADLTVFIWFRRKESLLAVPLHFDDSTC